MIALGYKNGNMVLQIEKDTITQEDADLYYGSIDTLTLEDTSTLIPGGPPAPPPEYVIVFGDPETGAVVRASSISSLAGMFSTVQTAANERINTLKAEVATAMCEYAEFSLTAANAEGSQFVMDHLPAIMAYIQTGGNPVAAAALLTDIQLDQRAWLQVPMGPGGPAIITLFEGL